MDDPVQRRKHYVDYQSDYYNRVTDHERVQHRVPELK